MGGRWRGGARWLDRRWWLRLLRSSVVVVVSLIIMRRSWSSVRAWMRVCVLLVAVWAAFANAARPRRYRPRSRDSDAKKSQHDKLLLPNVHAHAVHATVPSSQAARFLQTYVRMVRRGEEEGTLDDSDLGSQEEDAAMKEMEKNAGATEKVAEAKRAAMGSTGSTGTIGGATGITGGPEDTASMMEHLNEELPATDAKFLPNSTEAKEALDDTAVVLSEPPATATAATVEDANAPSSAAVVEKPKATDPSSSFHPVIVPDLGGSVMVHKESRLPQTVDPIVLPTVQTVDTMADLSKVRTPVGMQSANYNGTGIETKHLHTPIVDLKDPDMLPKDPKQLYEMGERILRLAKEREQQQHPEVIETEKTRRAARSVQSRLRVGAQDTFERVAKDDELHLFADRPVE